MPDEDNNSGAFLVLDFRKWWRHVQPKIFSLSDVNKIFKWQNKSWVDKVEGAGQFNPQVNLQSSRLNATVVYCANPAFSQVK